MFPAIDRFRELHFYEIEMMKWMHNSAWNWSQSEILHARTVR